LKTLVTYSIGTCVDVLELTVNTCNSRPWCNFLPKLTVLSFAKLNDTRSMTLPKVDTMIFITRGGWKPTQ
jgi:hypothetical protein